MADSERPIKIHDRIMMSFVTLQPETLVLSAVKEKRKKESNIFFSCLKTFFFFFLFFRRSRDRITILVRSLFAFITL